MKVLPATGTAAFLETISPHIPDDLIDGLFAHRCVRGRPRLFSPSQLFRVSLLPLLTPARSYNLIVIVIAKIHFRIEQMEAVLEGWSMKLLRAVQSRPVSSSEERAMKSQNQSALSLSHSRSMGLKSGE